jgi:general secretion pathway protein D
MMRRQDRRPKLTLTTGRRSALNGMESCLRRCRPWVLVTALIWAFVASEARSARLVEEGDSSSTVIPSSQTTPTPATQAPAVPVTPTRRPTSVPVIPATNNSPAVVAPGGQAPVPAQPGASPPAQPARRPGSEGKRPSTSDRITINFDNAELRTVIKFISELTGKNFLVDDKVKGTVTIISPTDITVEEAYQVFLSVLEMRGFTVVESGKVFKVVPSAEARYRDISIAKGEDLGPVGREDRMITQLVPLRYASANDVKGLLTPLISKDSQVVAYVPTNTLILTDYGANLRRLLSMIQEIDVESADEKITVVPLKYASAPTLATELLSLMDKGGQRGATRRTGTTGPTPTAPATPGVPVRPQPAQGGVPGAVGAVDDAAALSASKLVPDERTNSLIIIASDVETQKIMSLVEKLDVPLPPGRNKINVYYLEYAKAEEVLQVLSQLSGRGDSGMGVTRTSTGGLGTGGLGSTGLGSTGSSSRGLGSSSSLSGGFGSGLGGSGLGGRSTGSGFGGEGMFGGGTGLGSGAAGGGPRGVSLGDNIQVVADRGINALIVFAQPHDYDMIKDLIGKLDVPRSQVLVEGLIAEVSLTKSKSLGVEWQFLGSGNNAQTIGAGGLSGSATGATVPGSPFGGGLPNLPLGQLLLGVFQGPISIAGQQFLNLRAVMRAFQTADDVNILSTPHILTLNNEEAEIVVAQNVPFLKSQTGTAESTTTTPTTASTAVLQTFEFKDVGITLRILPQISKGKFVRLNIFQEVSDLAPGSASTTTPTTLKRQAKTVVVVENGQTVVIGGLIRDSQGASISGVPCLASVPILGNAFRTQTSGPHEKRNLLIFITPHIVTTSEDLAGITDEKRQEGDRAREEYLRLKQKDFDETMDMLLK